MASAIAFKTGTATLADHGVDDSGCGVNFSNRVIMGIGNEEVSCTIQRHIIRLPDAGIGGQAAIAPKFCGAVSDHGGYDLGCGVNFSDAVIVGVYNINIACRIQEYVERVPEPGAGCRPTVTRKSFGADTGHGGYDPGFTIHLSDPVIVGIGDIGVVGWIHVHPEGVIQPG